MDEETKRIRETTNPFYNMPYSKDDIFIKGFDLDKYHGLPKELFDEDRK